MKAFSKLRSRPLTFRDAVHLKTAKSCICVGDFDLADEEFRRIRRSAWTHPDVVKLRYTFVRTLHGW